MKKKIICLMIACLSLFAFPGTVNANEIFGNKDKTEIPVLPILTPAMEKKVNEFKKKHPEMFAKKESKDADETKSEAKKMGIVLFLSGSLLIVILILLLLFV